MSIWRVHLKNGKVLRIEADEVSYEADNLISDEVVLDPETLNRTYVELWNDGSFVAMFPRSEVEYCVHEPAEMPPLSVDSGGYRVGG